MIRSEFICFSAFLLLSLGGCSPLQNLRSETARSGFAAQDSSAPLGFLIKAHISNPEQLEALWKTTHGKDRSGPQMQLQSAVLQSFDGHSGTDFSAAEGRLKNLMQKYPNSGVAAVARLRLLELHTERQFEMQHGETVTQLKQVKGQLRQLVEIEQRMDRKVRTESP